VGHDVVVKDPVLVVVDPDGEKAVTVRELRERYGSTYRIVVHASAEDALGTLRDLSDHQPEVAVILADLAIGGADVLEGARGLHPHARRSLLLNWNENRSRREEVAAAFARRSAEGYVIKPDGRPDERFHRSVTELLDEWWRHRGLPAPSVEIVGDNTSPRVHEICDLLQRHQMSFVVHLEGSPAGQALRHRVGRHDGDHVVVVRDGHTLVDPSNAQMSEALGGRTQVGIGVYDVVVIGGGPAGLSAAVYAQSEGLRTALIEPTAMGGQAGTSSMIRNYLGFPRGISGAELAARAFEQAILFGTEMIYGTAAVDLRGDGQQHLVQLADGQEVRSRSVVVATGVTYQTLDVPELEVYRGLGVFYGAAMVEAPSMAGQEVLVVGGGNSAGQAAVHLARFAERVTMVIRGDTLARSMSEYLVHEIEGTANIEVHHRAQVVGGGGAQRLEHVMVRDLATGETADVAAAGLFVLIGARPHTAWLPETVTRDEWGYVETGPTADDPGRLPFETSAAGVFAVGDVRRDSVQRVASAVGEGAVCIRLVHDHLAG